MRCAPAFQVDHPSRAIQHEDRVSLGRPSTSSRKAVPAFAGVAVAASARFASMLRSMSGRTFHASLSRRRDDRRGAATLEASVEDDRGACREHCPLPGTPHSDSEGKLATSSSAAPRRGPRGAGIRAERRLPAYVLGGGRNVVFLDSGFPESFCASPSAGSSCATARAPRCVPGLASDWDSLGQAVVAALLDGVECLSGIPGTVGGTPIQKRGRVRPGDRRDAGKRHLPRSHSARAPTFLPADCAFGYRDSRFKRRTEGAMSCSRSRCASLAPAAAHPLPELERAVAELGGLDAVAAGDAVRLCARPCSRCGAASPWCSTRRTRITRSAGSFFHQPGAVGRRLR